MQALARNQYGHNIAGLGARTGGREVLGLPRPKDDSASALIVCHLLTRTPPKLFPEAYWDLHVPTKVRQLEAERGQVIAERVARIRGIDEQIEKE